MKSLHKFSLVAGLFATASLAFAQDFAPTNLSSVIFNGTITAATGGANSTGAVSTLFASNGIDYTISPTHALTDPVAFTYTKTSATAARITEPAVGIFPSVSIALTFSSASTGSFVATYGNSSTQTGTFALQGVAFTSPLVNVSTRTVLAANGTAITGFVIAGSGPRRVLIRAVGAGLASFGVQNTLANPSISLWRGGQMVGSNDDFDAATGQFFARVGAFALTAGSKDSALVTTLDPGAYSAQIKGGTSTEVGEVLLEVYFLD